LLAPRPTPKLEDHPLPAVRDCLFNVFAATLHTWRPFLHPQPEDAPCRGDRDPLNMKNYEYFVAYSTVSHDSTYITDTAQLGLLIRSVNEDFQLRNIQSCSL
jgi:hypothetical protein